VRRARTLAAGAALLAFAGLAAGENAPSIEAILGANAGKIVTVRLEGGQELTGTLAATSPVTVKLTGLQGKEFYDAVVRIDRIEAVIVRAPGK
jgi:hypothetical protein